MSMSSLGRYSDNQGRKLLIERLEQAEVLMAEPRRDCYSGLTIISSAITGLSQPEILTSRV
jgi:hypothetical protein